jgi:glucan 1,3-beta-glucosidase
MPTDPRQANGACNNMSPWTGTLAASATGGAGAGTIDPAVTASITWPPVTITSAGPITELPSYTPTGSVPTLKPATFTTVSAATATAKSIDAGNGWANPSDNAGLMVPIGGCQYNDAWLESAEPTPPVCTPARKRYEAAPTAIITSAPTPRS